MILNAYNIIKRPLLTEKITSLEKRGQYAFVVKSNTNKLQVKKALEKIFNIKIKSVNIVTVRSKKKVFKGQKGYKPGFKKAIITTLGMKKIDYIKGV
jgi:large subunit ribosomal protein L23